MAGRQKTAGSAKSKTIKIRHHHAKAYRKRHVSALFLFIIISSVLITWLLIYREQVNHNIVGAENYISDVFNPASTSKQNVSSTYGFSLRFDTRTFTASAIDAATGDLFVGQELGVNRAYQTIRISTGSSDVSKNSQRSLTLNYYDDVAATALTDAVLTEREKTTASAGIDTTQSNVRMVSSITKTISGLEFRVTEWKVLPLRDSIASKVPVEFRTYSGVVNGKAMVIKLTYGLSSGINREVFKPIVESLAFGERKQVKARTSKLVTDKINHSRTLIDTVLFTRLASAASATLDRSEEISSRYSPAVVKVYNLYCMDITIDGIPYAKDICDGSTGSGFFINGQGYIATNGHVASADPLDIVIKNSIENLVNGDQANFNYLANLAGVKDSDFSANATINEIVSTAVDKMYYIRPSRVAAVNNVYNLMVGLNEKQPNIEEMIKDTKNRQVYAEQNGVKKATLIAKDYRVVDGIVVNGAASFKASDVAIIKIYGSDFPVAKLGKLNAVSQGAGLLILGYPGEASNNGLVDATVSKPTLTAGRVSSIKTVSGSSKKLIETDATIGHGNSGGPVFDDSGNVIGIATYTIDGSGNGNGIYNYIRDIQDLKDLAAENSIGINGSSQTQAEWNKGIDLFYGAHYSKALKSFEKVQTLYPQHPKASDLIAAADDRIVNGQDVKDFPYILVVIAGASLVGIVVSSILIFRHHRAHKFYIGQVAEGSMEPMTKGDKVRAVPYRKKAKVEVPDTVNEELEPEQESD